MKLLVGADPELFLTHQGDFHSAHGLVKGTKKRPEKVENGAIQVDGLALEININPAKTEDEFVFSLSSVLDQLRAKIPTHLEFSNAASAEFNIMHMMQQPESALELGCEPDYNAYTGEANGRPDSHPTLRVAGGHFHLGWCKGAMPYDEDHFLKCQDVIKQMDYYVGAVSVLLDKDKRRRELYGKAGAFRPKSYGVEYRSPSNFWLFDQNYQRLCYRNIQLGYQHLEEGRFAYDKYGEAAKECIDNYDVDYAAALCKEIGIPTGLQ